MSQKLPVNKFEWIEDTTKFNEDFIKIYNDESDEEYFLEVDVQYREKLHKLHNDLSFLQERMKIGKVVTNYFLLIYMIKLNMKKVLKKLIDFFQLMNNAVFGKTTENVRRHRNIKLVTTERRRNYFV